MDRETYFDGVSYIALNSKSECAKIRRNRGQNRA